MNNHFSKLACFWTKQLVIWFPRLVFFCIGSSHLPVFWPFQNKAEKRQKKPHGLGRACVFEKDGCFFFEVATFEAFLNNCSLSMINTWCRYVEYDIYTWISENNLYQLVLSVLWFQRCLLCIFWHVQLWWGCLFSSWLRIYIDSYIHFKYVVHRNLSFISFRNHHLFTGGVPSTEPSNGCVVDDVFPSMVLFFQVPGANFEVSK